MAPDSDNLAHWLLGSVELDAAALHVGHYCGRWRASTAGRALGSFHLVLQGACFLHLPDAAPLPLGPGDGVFLLRDIEHFLSPLADAAAAVAPQPMAPLGAAGGAGLACGFFQLRGALSALIADAFPDYLVLRAGAAAPDAAAALFALILAERGGDPLRPSPLVARLVELLFFYLVRHAALQEHDGAGLLALARHGAFAPLLERLLREPGAAWSIERMAGIAHMSRASFCKHFAAACGQPPAQFLQRLRMQIAAQQLRAGVAVERAAEQVGYHSPAAFSRAFKRIIGEQPGAYRRARRLRQLAPRLDERAKNGDAGAFPAAPA
ncbi:helix-turn-helix transcriptional regulator [Janthinobacterium fluminis]|uniref:AraC family transcriptional regulator n=1 Tax=Janthinobacterium fluminis TaxID=2987524 RepID=A0ABT5K1B1_9BURK|nr:AraC family transcriptional regulator [Janthinobacterium fluminis]MDC8758767.1 AraC family transcriptional regulator [Janthinobacterium fluminis]